MVSDNLLLSYGFFLYFFLVISCSFQTRNRIFTELGQHHVWGDSYQSLTRIGGRSPQGFLGLKTLNNTLWLSNLFRKTVDASLEWWWPFVEVKGHQRSNLVSFLLWLPNLVKIIPETSLWWWWWPLWKSEVNWSKLWAMAVKLGHKNPRWKLSWYWPSWRSKVWH